MDFDIKKLLTVKDVEEARKYIGKKVFVSDRYGVIKLLKENKQVLEDVNPNSSYPFVAGEYNYEYCYPCEEETSETKYRPFTWDERELLRGKWLKRKDEITEFLVSGLSFEDEEFIIDIGNDSYFSISAEELLKKYTFLDGSPCGMEVEE